MSEAATAAQSERAANAIRELRVSGRLMTFEPGLFCIVHKPGANVDPATAMPGVRISLPPGPVGRPDAVSIKTFRDDGFLYGYGDAALVRVIGAPAERIRRTRRGWLLPLGLPAPAINNALLALRGVAGDE